MLLVARGLCGCTGFALVVVSTGYPCRSPWASRCGGFSCYVLEPLEPEGLAVAEPGLSCSAARGVFPDQGWSPRPLRWQVDSYPMRHQGSPRTIPLTQSPRHVTFPGLPYLISQYLLTSYPFLPPPHPPPLATASLFSLTVSRVFFFLRFHIQVRAHSLKK